MAKPQTEHGFVMIALDLFVGLLTSGLPDNDSIVLTWVLLQSYGPHKRKDVHLDFAEIEEYTGLHRNNARASARSLVASGYLRHNDDGSYRFLKDWEGFKPKRGAFVERLKLARFARAVLTHDKFIKRSKPVPIQPNCPDNSKANSTELGDNCKGQSGRIGSDTYAYPSGVNGTNGADASYVKPIAREGARPSEEFERLRVVPSEQQTDGDRGRNPQTFDELIAIIEAEFKPKVAAYFRRHRIDIEANFTGHFDCYLAAVRKASDLTDGPKDPHAWCRKVGGRFIAEGIPPEPVSLKDDSLASIAETPEQRKARNARRGAEMKAHLEKLHEEERNGIHS